jgi:hypothetical protein
MKIALPTLAAAVMLAQEPFDTDDPFDVDVRTGVEVGERIPEFRIKDLNGRVWDYQSIKGPKGAVLHFYRSADW